MTGEEYSSGPLDVPTLEVVVQRAVTHPLVDGWAFQPDAMLPRRLELSLDEDQYPLPIAEARLGTARWREMSPGVLGDMVSATVPSVFSADVGSYWWL